jgi:hypothetical protein
LKRGKSARLAKKFVYARLLQGQPSVVDKAAGAGEAAHLSALRAIGTQFELEGLEAFHEPMIRLVNGE